ncbi:PREDICTED: uncharacterized protein LOC109588592 [Amphimedon queenslandica]|uniref:Fibronectin type-III domain-containing protein n=1 Tax=Amphimedon queenslandica TaxID=400682 RepID=A0AAN0JT56_AMPQE|nr:PREDICTED: uncharacterized protein LOC109588592 [Amphimedon queenslandica]|eukprot:XP_019860297.1 PREDICTED: uncharacterized protein LOC109588592 [Amphimedon queenslandica]
MVDDNDIDIQALTQYNISSTSTFILITDLNDDTCYIFGVRAYSSRGPGSWRAITNETLISQEVCIGSNDKGAVDGASIGLGAVVGLLLISLAVSIIIHIYCFIKLKTYDAITAKQTKLDDDISMQACEMYGIHKTKDVAEEAAVYECPDVNVNDTDVYEDMNQ